MKLVLVDNPQSGSAISRKELREKCAAADITVEEFIAIGDGFESKLKPFIRAGKPIAVIGGDGTVSAVAGLVADTKATLIPLPGGTLNHFTKDLDIPQDIDEALARLATLSPRSIDIAKVNDTPFINNSSIGLYPTSLRSREQLESAFGKWAAAIVASWRAFVSFKTYLVTIDDETFEPPFIFVGNNRYELDAAGGTNRTRLDEGVLTVYAAKTQSRLTLLKIALFALIGRDKQLDEFEEFFPATLTIKTDHAELSVSHDGEVSKLTTPLRYAMQPKALTILG
ncbi:diacylglycerol/lipid kinase family protein [Bifidobacterium subtile]|jgi:diacylglycerol kinase family enzyme|uniref:diacylglycerol/lipid kinase family protein n=1 Tax=Bifidobacterium subtile TaxID=77635 RepID=UPI002F355ADD